MNSQAFARKRTVVLFGLFFFLFLLLAGRLIDIQLLQRGKYIKMANQFHHRTLTLPAARGKIYDRGGYELATNVPIKSIYVDPSLIKNKQLVANELSSILGMDPADLMKLLNRSSRFAWVKRQVPYDVGMSVEKLKIRGIGVFNGTRRVYPAGRLASHLLGYVNVDGNGVNGIENLEDSLIRGHDGSVSAEIDAKGRIISGTRKVSEPSRDGSSVYLTIDRDIQYSLESELEKTFKAYNAVGATAIAMDPQTGAILGIANMPTYDPNQPGKSSIDALRNRAITDLYEPGSTLKTITAAAALQEGTNTNIVCNGTVLIGKHIIHCVLHPPFVHGHGPGDIGHVLRWSCNIGAATIGLRLGSQKLYQYEKSFGLEDKPGTGLLGEQHGRFTEPSTWSQIQTANIAFGQGVAVTPLQLTAAYCAVANGGVLMKPQIIKEIHNADGKVTHKFQPIRTRRVISTEVSHKLTGYLESVVMDGTGKPAKIAGYRVAGKTGSAQKASTTGRGYAAGKFISSFIGYLPAGNPKVVILVVVDEPKGSHWGATTAAPVFREIARRIMWIQHVSPDDPNDHTDGAKMSTFHQRDHALGISSRSIAGYHPM